MTKSSFVLSKNIISILFGLSPCFGGDFGKIEFDAPKNKEYRITLGGFLTKSGTVNPNETMFTYSDQNKKYPNDPRCFSYVEYKFSGRTGEKTFEISRAEKIVQSRPTTEKISMYFDEANLYPLQITPIYVNCSKDEGVFLKMVTMQGNQLEYRIILPDCLAAKK